MDDEDADNVIDRAESFKFALIDFKDTHDLVHMLPSSEERRDDRVTRNEPKIMHLTVYKRCGNTDKFTIT